MKALWLALRSLLWAILLPGAVAGYVPWRVFGLDRVRLEPVRPSHLAGIAAAGAGVVLLALCIVDCARRGRGTLAPLDPPRELVVRGLYRYVRNPMYLSVALILAGELMLAPSSGFLLYAAAWFGMVNLSCWDTTHEDDTSTFVPQRG